MAKQLSPVEFTREFAKELRSGQPGLRVDIRGDKQLSLTNARGKTSTAYLDNAYTEYLRDPGAFRTIIKKFIDGLSEMARNDDAMSRAQIVPVVKDRMWITDIREALIKRGAENPPEHLYDDLNEELIIVYAEDNPKSIRYLLPKHLPGLGVGREELRDLAVENLKRLLPKIDIHPGKLFSVITADGTYEACLLLFDELWTTGQIEVDGDIVVAVPARDVLLVTGSRNPEGIAKLREVAAQISRDSPYRLTNDLFVYRQGAFRRLPQQ